MGGGTQTGLGGGYMWAQRVIHKINTRRHRKDNLANYPQVSKLPTFRKGYLRVRCTRWSVLQLYCLPVFFVLDPLCSDSTRLSRLFSATWLHERRFLNRRLMLFHVSTHTVIPTNNAPVPEDWFPERNDQRGNVKTTPCGQDVCAYVCMYIGDAGAGVWVASGG